MLRVALYSGLCVQHDAISNSLRLKLDLMESWCANGLPVEAVAFVHFSDCDDPRIHAVDSVADLLQIPAFRAADVHIFEFGIYYPLFDSVFLLPEGTPAGAVYHNVTPPALADDPGSRSVLDRSLIQRYNLSRMRHVACNSEFSRRELLVLGFPPEQVSVIPLPPGRALHLPNVTGRRQREGVIEVLFVGRFVRAKGVIDLLDAVSSLVDNGRRNFRLTMAGNPQLSTPHILVELEDRCSRPPLSDVVRIVRAPDDRQLAKLYVGADLFVIPSYHEGYCVPVVEALATGCQVIAYDSSNLPYVLGDLGQLVRTGDVAELAATLQESIVRLTAARERGEPSPVRTTRGEMDECAWREAVEAHLGSHSGASFEAGFSHFLATLVAGTSLSSGGQAWSTPAGSQS